MDENMFTDEQLFKQELYGVQLSPDDCAKFSWLLTDFVTCMSCMRSVRMPTKYCRGKSFFSLIMLDCPHNLHESN